MTHGLPDYIAREVRAEIARQRVTQRHVAEILGMTQSQVGARLRCEIEFRPSELETLAEAFGVPVTTFLPTRAEVSA